jgi:ParB/RepB/Spo0J family partition protein
MPEYPKYVEDYPIEKLTLNDWNPNEMDLEKMKSLERSIKERGFLVPIVANKDGKIIEGEHRYLASKECGLKQVPVMLAEMEEDEMKMSTIGLNNIRGCDSPIKLAKLLQDLNQRHSLQEIAEKIGSGSESLKDKLELLKIPGDLLQQLKENSVIQEQEVPSVLHFAVSKEQEKTIMQALELFEGKSKGEKLYALCTAYIRQKPKNE